MFTLLFEIIIPNMIAGETRDIEKVQYAHAVGHERLGNYLTDKLIPAFKEQYPETFITLDLVDFVKETVVKDLKNTVVGVSYDHDRGSKANPDQKGCWVCKAYAKVDYFRDVSSDYRCDNLLDPLNESYIGPCLDRSHDKHILSKINHNLGDPEALIRHLFKGIPNDTIRNLEIINAQSDGMNCVIARREHLGLPFHSFNYHDGNMMLTGARHIYIDSKVPDVLVYKLLSRGFRFESSLYNTVYYFMPAKCILDDFGEYKAAEYNEYTRELEEVNISSDLRDMLKSVNALSATLKGHYWYIRYVDENEVCQTAEIDLYQYCHLLFKGHSCGKLERSYRFNTIISPYNPLQFILRLYRDRVALRKYLSKFRDDKVPPTLDQLPEDNLWLKIARDNRFESLNIEKLSRRERRLIKHLKLGDEDGIK